MARSKTAPPDEAEPAEGTVVTNGQPDEVSAKRSAKKASKGTSIAERADDIDVDIEDEMELFPIGSLAGDPKVSHKNIIKGGMPVETTAALSRAAVPMKDGLFNPDERTHVLVTVLPGKLTYVPVREERAGEQRVVGWEARQELRSIYVQPAGDMYTAEQVIEMLDQAEVPSAKIGQLMGTEALGTSAA